MPGLVTAVVTVVGLFFLFWFLRRRDQEGYWDKEGFGTPDHQKPGVQYRPMEVPPKEPFD